jgi:hypothetical protein
MLFAEYGTAAEWSVAGGTLLLALATFALAWGAREQVAVAAEHVVAIQRPLVAPIGLHEARHTAASVMIAAGVNVKALRVSRPRLHHDHA